MATPDTTAAPPPPAAPECAVDVPPPSTPPPAERESPASRAIDEIPPPPIPPPWLQLPGSAAVSTSSASAEFVVTLPPAAFLSPQSSDSPVSPRSGRRSTPKHRRASSTTSTGAASASPGGSGSGAAVPPPAVELALGPRATPQEPYAGALLDAGRAGAALERALSSQARALKRALAARSEELARCAGELRASASALSRALEAASGSSRAGCWLAFGYTPAYVAAYRCVLARAREMLAALPQGQAEAEAAVEALRSIVTRVPKAAGVVRAQASLLGAARAVLEAGAVAAGNPPPADLDETATCALCAAEHAIAELMRLSADAHAAMQYLEARDVVGRMDLCPGVAPLPQCDDRTLVARADFVVEAPAFGLRVTLPAHLLLMSDVLVAALPQASGRYHVLEWYDLCALYVVTGDPGSASFMLASLLPDVKALGSMLPPGWEEPLDKGARHATYTFKPTGAHQAQRPQVPRLRGLREYAAKRPEDKTPWIDRLLSAARTAPTVVTALAGDKVPYTMFGVPLDDILEHERSVFGSQLVPIIAQKIFYEVISGGLHEQGLMRVGGGLRVLRDLRQAACSGTLEFKGLNPATFMHELTGLLKMFLREMPVPLIPPDVSECFLAAASATGPDQREAQVRAFNMLPHTNRALLRELLAFLTTVAANSHVNSMTSQNLAIVVAPNVIRASTDVGETSIINDALTALINGYWDFFEAPNAPLARESAPTEFFSFRRKLLGHSKSIRVLAMARDMHQLWSVDSDGEIRIWDTLRCTFVAALASAVRNPTSICAVEDRMLIGSVQGLFVYDTAARRLVRKELEGLVVLSMAYMAQRREVWCGSSGNVYILRGVDGCGAASDDDPRSPRCTTTTLMPAEQGAGITDWFSICVASTSHVWCAGCKRGATAEQYIHVWDMTAESGYQRVGKIHTPSKKTSKVVAVGDAVWSSDEQGQMFVWNARTYECEHSLTPHKNQVFDLAVLPDQVWSCSWDKTIKIWDAASLQCVGVITGYHTDTVSRLASCVDPASGLINVWSASFDRALCVWYVKSIPSRQRRPSRGVSRQRSSSLHLGEPSQPSQASHSTHVHQHSFVSLPFLHPHDSNLEQPPSPGSSRSSPGGGGGVWLTPSTPRSIGRLAHTSPPPQPLSIALDRSPKMSQLPQL
eukprot:m51a1_g347 putative domain-containing protein (1151) ;mRNA; f:541095-544899